MQKQFTVEEAFGFPGANIPCRGEDAPNEFTPENNVRYVFRKEPLRVFRAFMESEQVALELQGPKGSGKTSLAEQYFARLNLPLLSITAHERTEPGDLIGYYVINDEGKTEFLPGPVTKAAMEGWGVLINESNAMPPGTSTALNEFLQGSAVYIPELRQTIKPKPGFKVICTTNPEDDASYRGRYLQDAAYADRFMKMRVDYMDSEAEEGLLSNVLSDYGHEDPEPMAKSLVDVANRVRTMYKGGTCRLTISTRALINWAKRTLDFAGIEQTGVNPIYYALDLTVCNHTRDVNSVKAVKETVLQVFGVPEVVEVANAADSD